jgi:hypothetical protein
VQPRTEDMIFGGCSAALGMALCGEHDSACGSGVFVPRVSSSSNPKLKKLRMTCTLKLVNL